MFDQVILRCSVLSNLVHVPLALGPTDLDIWKVAQTRSASCQRA